MRRWVLAAGFLLTACGGGGDEGTTPTTDEPTTTTEAEIDVEEEFLRIINEPDVDGTGLLFDCELIRNYADVLAEGEVPLAQMNTALREVEFNVLPADFMTEVRLDVVVRLPQLDAACEDYVD